MIKGMYVNSPHILVRFEVPPGQNEYTIVLSQHVKTRDLHFTLRAYAVCEFELREIPNKYAIEKKVTSAHERRLVSEVGTPFETLVLITSCVVIFRMPSLYISMRMVGLRKQQEEAATMQDS
jgi:hypothetical protein